MRLPSLLLGFALLLGTPVAFGQAAPDPRPKPTVKAFVHIEADAPLSLRRNVGRFGDVVCAAPCDRGIAFDPPDRFSIEGAFPRAQPFTLGQAGPRVLLRVDTGSHGGFYGGITLATAGGAAALMSGVIFLLAAVGDALGSGEGVEDRLKYGCLGAAIGGGVAMAVGIPLLVVSETKVEVLPDPRREQARGIVTVRF
ncbi:hypothetical protein [Polyangium mundeleinium]|uniref:Uncharacterized protein n=1 Tax=Polyangium mundeleinium TaxID=2995306 RepID=A0ABT5F3F8_9BACT|nr:hypothetical protein [Polyangium mundeleinium]MDC0747610.1 hypothetical protein [Polyangium mundeleinium]